MKKILYLLSGIFVSINSYAAPADTIPNSGFERWGFSTWFQVPQDWMTNNSQILPPVVMGDSNAHSGLSSMRLLNTGALVPHAYCGFAISTHPQNMGGYFNPSLMNNDSAWILVRLFYNNQAVDSGSMALYNGIIPGYTPFLIPLSQSSINADSCEISVFGGTMSQSSVLFDDFEFNFLLGTSEITAVHFLAYPNPAHDRLILNTENIVPESIEAYQTNGQRVRLWSAEISPNVTNQVSVDVSVLAPGAWVIAVVGKDEIRYGTVIIE
jgi:hypothetical protein